MSALTVKECPQCGAPADQKQNSCEYCQAVFFITKISYFKGLGDLEIKKYLNHYKKNIQEYPESADSHLGLGITYLELGMTDLAFACFEKSITISPDSASAYFYSCLAKVKGRRVMTLTSKEIADIIARINAARILDSQNPAYSLLLAMIKKDYFHFNKIRDDYPLYNELLDELNGVEVDGKEVACIKRFINVDNVDYYIGKVTLK